MLFDQIGKYLKLLKVNKQSKTELHKGVLVLGKDNIIKRVELDKTPTKDSRKFMTSGDIYEALNSIDIPTQEVGATTDHGSLSGLTDNDHPQYLLVADAALAYEPKDSNITKDNVAENITANWTFSHVDGINIGTFELTESILESMSLAASILAGHTAAEIDAAISAGNNQSVFLTDDFFAGFGGGTGILKRTGLNTYAYIADASTNWNSAYSHSQITTGNPHGIGAGDISDFNSSVDSRWNTIKGNNETISGNWSFSNANGINIGTFELTDTILQTFAIAASILSGHTAQEIDNAISAGNSFAAALFDEDFEPNSPSDVGIMIKTAEATYNLTPNNTSNWDSAYADTNNATSASTANRIVKRDASKNIYVNNVYFGA